MRRKALGQHSPCFAYIEDDNQDRNRHCQELQEYQDAGRCPTVCLIFSTKRGCNICNIYLESSTHERENRVVAAIATCDWAHLWLQMLLVTMQPTARPHFPAKPVPISTNACGNAASAPNWAMRNGSVFLPGLAAALSVPSFSIHRDTCAG